MSINYVKSEEVTEKARVVHESLKLPGQKTCSKISKCHFFRGIQNYFHGIADRGLEPHQNFFSKCLKICGR